MFKKLSLVLALCVAAPAVATDSTPLERTMSEAHLQAIGRLDIGKLGFCTATLVSRDLVLTAAHCMFDKTNGQRINMQDLKFHVGLRGGASVTTRQVKRVAVHPDYDRSRKGDLRNMRYDLALLQLDMPLQMIDVASLGVSSPQLGQDVGVISYARSRAESAQLEESCAMSARPEGVYVTTCQAGYGTSGAPVMQVQQGLPRVVSVVSAMAKANGQPVTLAVGVSNALSVLTSEMGS